MGLRDDDIEDCDRINRAKAFEPYIVEFPLTRKPLMFKEYIAADLAKLGILTCLYDRFVTAFRFLCTGQAQFRQLLELRPESCIS